MKVTTVETAGGRELKVCVNHPAYLDGAIKYMGQGIPSGGWQYVKTHDMTPVRYRLANGQVGQTDPKPPLTSDEVDFYDAIGQALVVL